MEYGNYFEGPSPTLRRTTFWKRVVVTSSMETAPALWIFTDAIAPCNVTTRHGVRSDNPEISSSESVFFFYASLRRTLRRYEIHALEKETMTFFKLSWPRS